MEAKIREPAGAQGRFSRKMLAVLNEGNSGSSAVLQDLYESVALTPVAAEIGPLWKEPLGAVPVNIMGGRFGLVENDFTDA